MKVKLPSYQVTELPNYFLKVLAPYQATTSALSHKIEYFFFVNSKS